jgi:hypothetical protein
MSQPESEKVVGDTFRKMEADGRVEFFHRCNTPQYFREPIDFFVSTPDSRTHYIEVKESGDGNVAESQFKDYQKELLETNLFNQDGSGTRAWIIARLFDGEHIRSHSNYYEWYFLLPGSMCSDTISIAECRRHDGCHYLGKYEYGEWVNMSDDDGLTTKGNPTRGIEDIQFPGDL